MALSEIQLQQRQEAARKHRVYTFQDHGEAALDAQQRSRLVEVQELTQDHGGIVILLQERAARAVMLAELAEAWIQRQAEQGVPFDKMTLLNRVSTFQETARRALQALVAVTPETSRQDVTEILQGFEKEHDST